MRLPILFTSALLAAPALFAQQLSEVEPNDTAATANALVIGNQLNANLVAAEADWYTFTLASAARVALFTNGLDTRMELYDATGTTIAGLDDDGRTSSNAFASSLFINLTAGTYTVKIVGYSATTTGLYSVDLGVFSTFGYSGVEVEPNQVVAQATPVTIPSGGAQIQASLSAPTVQLTDAVLAGSTTTLMNATAALTAGAYAPTIAGYGTYYVKFTSGANAGFMRQISANTATTITCTAFTTAPAAGDTYEVVLVDVDFYQITLAQQSGLWFQVNEGDAPFVCGHRYEFYDAAGVPLLASSTTQPAYGTNAGNSSSLSARTSQIRVWPAGTYTLAIRPPTAPFTAPYNVLTSGNYRLEIFELKMYTGATVAEVEPNNSVATATPLGFGGVGTGNVTNSTGADAFDIWGPIVVTKPSTLIVQSAQDLSAGAGTAILDTTVNLLSNTGSIALAATTGNILSPTSHGRVAVSFGLPGTYYVEVRSPGTGTTQVGNYKIELSQVIDVPYQAASYSIVASNATCGVAPFPTIALDWTSERPVLGTLFTRKVNNCPASAPLFLVQGLSNTLANGSLPLPLDLTSFGAGGCFLNVDPAITFVGIADGTGVARFDSLYPGQVSLRGIPLFEQAAVLQPTANSLGIQFSNYARIISGERSY